jgi:hypothetical protein
MHVLDPADLVCLVTKANATPTPFSPLHHRHHADRPLHQQETDLCHLVTGGWLARAEKCRNATPPTAYLHVRLSRRLMTRSLKRLR